MIFVSLSNYSTIFYITLFFILLHYTYRSYKQKQLKKNFKNVVSKNPTPISDLIHDIVEHDLSYPMIMKRMLPLLTQNKEIIIKDLLDNIQAIIEEQRKNN